MTNPVLVRTYQGATPDESAVMFENDAEQLGRAGYAPTSQVWHETALTVSYQRHGWAARRFYQEGFVVVAAGVLATIGALMQWYEPARAFVFPDLSGVALSSGTILVPTLGLVVMGLDIALTGRLPAALLAAAAAVLLLVPPILTAQTVAALNHDPSGVQYTLSSGIWVTSVGGALGLLGAVVSLMRRFGPRRWRC